MDRAYVPIGRTWEPSGSAVSRKSRYRRHESLSAGGRGGRRLPLPSRRFDLPHDAPPDSRQTHDPPCRPRHGGASPSSSSRRSSSSGRCSRRSRRSRTRTRGWLWVAAAAFGAGLICAGCAWRAATHLPDRVDACARYGVGSLVNSLAPAHAGDAVRLALFAKASPDSRLLTAGRRWPASGSRDWSAPGCCCSRR